MLSAQSLASLYRDAHNLMRNTDGLQPQEAFGELLKYLFLRQHHAGSAALPRHVARTHAPQGPNSKLQPRPRELAPSDLTTANALRRGFAACVKALQGQSSAYELWRDRKFSLSDAALLALHQLFADVDFSGISFDVWSAALRMFLGPDLRRGLGIYLTPDAVVQSIVAAVAPAQDAVVYDPACGSGTFLIETLRSWRATQPAPRALYVQGSDINARMLLLAELSLGQLQGVEFARKTLDALTHPSTTRQQTAEPPHKNTGQPPSGRAQRRAHSRAWPQPDSIDIILTNPPFGTYIEPQAVAAQHFTTLAQRKAVNGSKKSSSKRGSAEPDSTLLPAIRRSLRMQSEILFIEQCLRWLRPEGLLAIIVPRSVLTNASLSHARTAIDRLARLTGLLTLPPETFATTGTQTNTCVLFLRKRSQPAAHVPTNEKVVTGRADLTRVAVVDVDNVGVDSTGRQRAGSQLTQAGRDLQRSLTTGRAVGLVRHVRVPSDSSLSMIANAAARSIAATRTSSSAHHPTNEPSAPADSQTPRATTTRARHRPRRLADVVELAQTGRTPARAAYTADGIFTLKVGNLTGQGIDWTPRDRNYVAAHFVSGALFLRDGDIVLTASAHNPKYIAQKVDIVHSIPEFAGGQATFVGEVLRLRVKPAAMNPFELLAILRSPDTRTAIQRLIRGQTAHLRPKDLLELPLPHKAAPTRLVELLQREAELARELNLIMAGQRDLLSMR